jgi:hypothetical protein
MSLLLGACATQSGLVTTIPPGADDSFSRIERFRIRAITTEELFSNHPYQVAANPDSQRLGVDQHHPTALNAALRHLEQKGYSVTVVWDDPYSYGERPCIGPKPGDPQYSSDDILAMSWAGESPPRPEWLQRCYDGRGEGYRGIYLTQLDRYTGSLAADEAFLELATYSDAWTETTTYSYSTETHAGRITDASGNTVANIYTTVEDTRVQERTREFASVNAQVFTASQTTAIYDAQAWTETTASLTGPTDEVLAAIPARTKAAR